MDAAEPSGGRPRRSSKAAVGRFEALLTEVRACRVCESQLIDGVRPVLAAHPDARVLIIGQAPGRKVHTSGVPWDDPSGVRLRDWLGVDEATFYDPERFAIVPMGFCFPGSGKSGDLPPRPECADLWHARLLAGLPRIELTLLLSRFAIDRYLGDKAEKRVTDTVRAWKQHLPRIPLPHPSPRNRRWFATNPWFEAEVVPAMRARVHAALG